MSWLKGASLMPGPAINLANQVLGSGRKVSAWPRFGLGRLSKPTSQAEMGETKTPAAFLPGFSFVRMQANQSRISIAVSLG